jgi:hypothetical protein
MTEPDGDANATPLVVPIKNDPNYHEYEFAETDWISPPAPKDFDWFGKEERTIRDAHAYAYQQFGTTYHWSRYVQLGYFAFINCTSSDKVWSNVENDPLMVHRSIWYNFMFHVEHDIPSSDKLNAWALNVSQPFLEYYDEAYLTIDTLKYPNGVASTLETEENEESTTEQEWIPVTEKKRSHSPDKQVPEEAPRKRGGILRQPSQPDEQKTSKKKKNKKSNSGKKNTPPSVTITQDQDVATMPNDNADEMEIDEASTTSKNSVYTIADLPPRIPSTETTPYQKTPINDGTHRITVKWTPPSQIDEFENDEQRLNEALYTLMQTLFQDDDGVFYPWDSETTSNTKAASSLTETTAREFVSPKVTFVGSRSLIVFGIRFGFLEGPSKWQYSDRTKSALKDQKIDILISNSTSTSGKVVTAGYILLKTPNSTHRHFYTQYLRSMLPETTPYFDIVRYKTTPMDQLIPHLAVQCGDKHVAPLCKALLSILTGKGCALFLPRYALNTMSPDQVRRHFEVHKSWSRSLKSITLETKISHLDRQRVEYFDDGNIVKRSTREWILSLTLKNGQPAFCDAVNGGTDRKATLVSPQTFLEQAKDEWRQYKSRLNPPSHRETRYYASLVDVPDLSNIRTEVETNVSILNHLSTADIWKQAPPSVKAPNPKGGKPSNNNKKIQNTKAKPTPKAAPSEHQSDISEASDSESHTTAGEFMQDGIEDLSTTTTTASTNAPPPDFNARIQELERMIKSAQKRSDVEGKASAAQLSGLQSQFNHLDGKISALQETQEKLSTAFTTMREQNIQQLETIRGNILTSMEATNNTSQSMADIRQQFSQMSVFIMELARKMETMLDRRDGVPPEVNVTRPTVSTQQYGSATSSVLGDPSQTAISDVSKTTSLLSSTGKRSLAAVQVQVNPQAETISKIRRSPSKKKQRARNPNETKESDSTEEEDSDSEPQRMNLDAQFQMVDNLGSNDDDDDNISYQRESDSSDTSSTGSEMQDETVDPTTANRSTAPPNRQYNATTGSAGAEEK